VPSPPAGVAVGVAVAVGEADSSDSLCAEICSSSFHCPPSFTRPQRMRKRGMPVLSTKETSAVAVAVVPNASSTVSE
jgi:hypothetical protein